MYFIVKEIESMVHHKIKTHSVLKELEIEFEI